MVGGLKINDDLLSNEDLEVVQRLEKEEEAYEVDTEEADEIIG